MMDIEVVDVVDQRLVVWQDLNGVAVAVIVDMEVVVGGVNRVMSSWKAPLVALRVDRERERVWY